MQLQPDLSDIGLESVDARIFDIDGTLVDSNGVDSDLFLDAVKLHVGPIRARPDWSCYTHGTDTGILDELLRDNEINCTPNLKATIRTSFVDLIADHVTAHGPFREIYGAKAFVYSILKSPGKCVAYATGGWRESARIKLESAGFPVDNIVIAAADDHHARHVIKKLALIKLGYEFDTVTYYGDAPWDQISADNLGWNFVGVGERVMGIENYDVCSA